MYRLIVSGWRAAKPERHRLIVESALLPIHDTHGPGYATLVHGDGDGVDHIAAEIARDFGWTVEAHPAAWEECGEGCPPRPHRVARRGGSFCPAAGPRRNRQMCALAADLLIAFPGPGSRGTWDCIRVAARHGIPAQIWPLAVERG